MTGTYSYVFKSIWYFSIQFSTIFCKSNFYLTYGRSIANQKNCFAKFVTVFIVISVNYDYDCDWDCQRQMLMPVNQQRTRETQIRARINSLLQLCSTREMRIVSFSRDCRGQFTHMCIKQREELRRSKPKDRNSFSQHRYDCEPFAAFHRSGHFQASMIQRILLLFLLLFSLFSSSTCRAGDN